MAIFPRKLQTESSKFYFSNLTPIRKLEEFSTEGLKFTLDEYEDGRMHGIIEGTVTEITEEIKSHSPDCFIGDILGICYKSEKANIPFTIKFNLALE